MHQNPKSGEGFDPTTFDMDSINKAFFKNFKKEMKKFDDLAMLLPMCCVFYG